MDSDIRSSKSLSILETILATGVTRCICTVVEVAIIANLPEVQTQAGTLGSWRLGPLLRWLSPADEYGSRYTLHTY